MTHHHVYQVKSDLKPARLEGLSEDQISQHWKLYEGYVKNVNELNQRIAELSDKGTFGVEFAELKRRAGFEYDGMILHEHYFGVLKRGQPKLEESSQVVKLFKKTWGGFDAWKREFTGIGKMRGVGWAILYLDPRVGALTNHWVNLHESGHPAGFTPILVMDVWEHAFMIDFGAGGRGDYIDAFFKNVNWPKVEKSLQSSAKLEFVEA